MIESAFLGIIQGITEWLPISSEGFLVFLKINLLKENIDLIVLINYALFLHLGTFLSALIYFRKELIRLFGIFLNYGKATQENKKLINFYIIATFISGIVALAIIRILDFSQSYIIQGSKGITFLIGLALLITAFLQIKRKSTGIREEKNLKLSDGIFLGFLQGFSIIPGISRSGITISGLLLRKINDSVSLRLSFIMSLPVILIGNLFLNLDKFILSFNNFIGLLFSFVFGILTIHIFLKFSKKINFTWFVLFFAVIVLFSALI